MSYKTIYSIIPESTTNEIPLSANKIIINNNSPLSENYTKSYKTLLSQDYRIENDNKEMGYILASKQDIGDTQVRLNVRCEDSLIQITSEWTAGTQTALMMNAMSGVSAGGGNFSWYNAQWNKRSDKSSVAFANAVKVATAIGGNLTYLTKELTTNKSQDKNTDPIYN